MTDIDNIIQNEHSKFETYVFGIKIQIYDFTNLRADQIQQKKICTIKEPTQS